MTPSTKAAHPLLRRALLASVCLGGIHLSSPWPSIQAVFHVLLVLGIAPAFRSPLAAALWAAAAGWLLEGSLRVYPRLGGTPLANMGAALLALGLLQLWPPHRFWPFWGRLSALVLGHALLVHLCVRIAAGPHAWGMGWLWALLTVPLWGSLALWLHRPPQAR